MSDYATGYDQGVRTERAICSAEIKELEAENKRLREAVKDLLETDSFSAWEIFLGESRYAEIKALAGKDG